MKLAQLSYYRMFAKIIVLIAFPKLNSPNNSPNIVILVDQDTQFNNSMFQQFNNSMFQHFNLALDQLQ